MTFSSCQFIFAFLPITLIGFYLLARVRMTWAQVWLIAASFFFYAYWKWQYLPLLLGSLTVNFLLTRFMQSCTGERPRKTCLILGLIFNVSLLGYFKYANFVLTNLLRIGLPVPAHFDIALPLAISFFTFTQIAFVIDSYNHPEIRYSLLDYTFFVSFFPHLIAGPIVRHSEIIPQLKDWFDRLSYQSVVLGLSLFIIGLAKKCWLADALAPHVDGVYNAAAAGTLISTHDAWLGTVAFAFQIYFDFSAYSDMALGLALMFGLRFPLNFDSPYKATSIIGFWRQWHMTLSRFLRDYLHTSIALTTTRLASARQMGPRLTFWMAVALPTLATFMIAGLWHGAGWSFIVFGTLHGLYLVVANVWRGWSKKLGLTNNLLLDWLGCALTFVAVLWTWVWFRAGHVSTAWQLTLSLLGRQHAGTGEPLIGNLLALLLPLLLLAVWIFPNSQQLLGDYQPALDKIPVPGAWKLQLNFATVLFFGLFFLLITRESFVNASTVFIYFKF